MEKGILLLILDGLQRQGVPCDGAMTVDEAGGFRSITAPCPARWPCKKHQPQAYAAMRKLRSEMVQVLDRG